MSKAARKPAYQGKKLKPLSESQRNYMAWKAERDAENEAYPGLHLARELETSTLKILWQEHSGATTSQPSISSHAVRRVLTERGEGHYCDD